MSRKDGKWAKYIYPMLQMTPHIMPHRWDSANYARADVRCDYLDRFIANQAEKGEHFTYNDILIAAIVRMYSERIQMNRFVVGNKIYDRYDLTIAFAVKKVLKDNASETVVKVNFDGSESIFDVRDKLKAAFEDNSGSKVNNGLDLFMNKLLKLPALAPALFYELRQVGGQAQHTCRLSRRVESLSQQLLRDFSEIDKMRFYLSSRLRVRHHGAFRGYGQGEKGGDCQ